MKLPQLSLRDLFWLVLVAGILCAWWLDRMITSEVRCRAEAERLELQQERLTLKKQRDYLDEALAETEKSRDLLKAMEGDRFREGDNIYRPESDEPPEVDDDGI
jgi:hypothetical protein